ncbi:MAG: glycosyltransferase [Deltaproteobacteria bacterium]|nr:glycosyltransferase [Deltaproteobacteria bacterium]
MITLVHILTVILSLFWISGGLIQILGTLIGLWPNKIQKKVVPAFSWEPISILKPLRGLDVGLEANLTTFLTLDYPSYEILFSVTSVNDPAYSVAKKLMEQYPNVATRLFVDSVEVGPNPKVNNMRVSYEASRNDLILISDSNVRVTRDYLKILSGYLRDPKVGMVTAVISGSHEEGLGGRLEAVFLNTFYARSMRLLFFLNRPCVVGKSMLFRKTVAKRFGGIAVLARYLAEDYMAGEAIKRLGLSVVLATEPVTQYIGQLKLKDFWLRHIRWGRIRKSQVLLAFLIEPFFGAVLPGVMGAYAFYLQFQFNPFLFFILHMLIFFLLEIPFIKKIKGTITPLVFFIWFLRELLALPLWLNIAWGNTVHWRGRTFKLRQGGLLAE